MPADGVGGVAEPGTKSTTDAQVHNSPAANHEDAGAASTSKTQNRPSRRKKASRACYHCQKAHLTCDDSRPCQRCIRKGLADQCVDGFRKKAKYLLEEDEILTNVAPPVPRENIPRSAEVYVQENMIPSNPGFASTLFDSQANRFARLNGAAANFSRPDMASSAFQGAEAPEILPNGFTRADASATSLSSEPPASSISRLDMSRLEPPTGAVSSLNFEPSAAFGFDPTSLESSILSSMLHGADGMSLNGDSPDLPTVPAMDLMDSYTHFSNVPSNGDVIAPSWPSQPVRPSLLAQAPSDMGVVGRSYPEVPSSLNSTSALKQQMDSTALSTDAVVSPAVLQAQDTKRPPEPRVEQTVRLDTDQNQDLQWRQRVARIYRDKTRPFPYTNGYHILIKYATQKYDKADVLRIVRALAIYRPSLIALQMPLSEEDEIFVERAFQRTMLEFERLISFSGTPTVVWRRTCEIVLVGAEFCMLTQWSKEDLLGKYMYQFMDKDSVVHYWENFASHAFENASPSVMTRCALFTPSGKSIPCTWCFTIKRDPFDLPGFVVGNVRNRIKVHILTQFLPILS